MRLSQRLPVPERAAHLQKLGIYLAYAGRGCRRLRWQRRSRPEDCISEVDYDPSDIEDEADAALVFGPVAVTPALKQKPSALFRPCRDARRDPGASRGHRHGQVSGSARPLCELRSYSPEAAFAAALDDHRRPAHSTPRAASGVRQGVGADILRQQAALRVFVGYATPPGGSGPANGVQSLATFALSKQAEELVESDGETRGGLLPR